MQHTEARLEEAMEPKAYGVKITKLRKEKGISQKQLAEASGVPLTAIRRCEQKGQIPLHRYLAITSALGAVVEIKTRPETLPFNTIEAVIAANSAAKKRSAEKPAAHRQPQLGGKFDQMGGMTYD